MRRDGVLVRVKPDGTEEEMPIPPATFDFFVLSMKMQAEMSLGLIHFGEEKDRPKPDLRVARHSIDLLSMIAEKTRGNLTAEERQVLESVLYELRLRFVEVSGAGKKIIIEEVKNGQLTLRATIEPTNATPTATAAQ